MKIGIIQVDGKWPNLALMKISTWHKQQGDQVEWFQPIIANTYDKVYASKIFNNTPDYHYMPKGTTRGGTGYDLFSHLPQEIENCRPDYTLYPDWGKAIGYTTRGCVRTCPFCVVPQKEGGITVVGDIYDFWVKQKEIVLLDNNLTAAPFEHFKRIIKQINEHSLMVEFSQGLDIRLINDEHCKLLKTVRMKKQLHFAWDNIDDEDVVIKGIARLKRYFHPDRLSFYVLIGYNTKPEEDLYRVEKLRSLGVDSFVMPYNKADPYQRSFARWVNHKAVFNSVSWGEYALGKGAIL